MSQNATLRYGFDWDRDFLDFIMTYHYCIPVVTFLTLHPMVIYLLLFESKSMRSEIRRGYLFTYSALILDEWSFCFFFRLYAAIPYAAIYCEGPLCRLGLNKQILTTLLSIPVVLINPPFHFLVMRLHQMLVPPHIKWKLSKRIQCLLGVIECVFMTANVVGFGVFGRDHDRAEEIMKDPEVAWLVARGGNLFLFGPPADPQYFKWELLLLGAAFLLLSPPLLYFTSESMKIISSTSDNANLSGSTQVMTRRMSQVFLHQWLGALFHYIVPLSFILVCMTFDTRWIPGWIYAPSRALLLIIFTLNSWQFGLLFIAKNPTYRKALLGRLNQLSFGVFSHFSHGERNLTNRRLDPPSVLSNVTFTRV